MAKKKSALDLLTQNEGKKFLEDHWPSKKFLKHGSIKRFDELFTDLAIRNINLLLDRLKSTGSSLPVRVWFQNREGKQDEAYVNSEAAKSLFSSGKVTLLIDGIDEVFPEIKNLLESLVDELGTPQTNFGCNIYCSPKGEGTKAHFDAQEVILVQLKGKKQWKLSENENLKYPHQSFFGNTEPSDDLKSGCSKLPIQPPKKHEIVTLEPGSILFLPRGYWHESHTIEDSVALTLTFCSTIWIDLVFKALAKNLISKEDWRKPGVGIQGKGKQNQLAKQHFKARLDELSTEVEKMKRLLSKIK